MLGAIILSLFLSSPLSEGLTTNLPKVDLGYEVHEASSLNVTGAYYNFSNIRYGEPPVGSLRWRPPVAPRENRATVQKGEVGRICPQSWPVWYQLMLASFTSESQAAQDLAKLNPLGVIPPPDPRESEDCLFLDVLVPTQVFEKKQKNDYKGAPVMVWIYGGGFTFTDNSGNPAGLIRRSQEREADQDGIIYVKPNYRGGAFGFLSGSDLQNDGTSNVGLLDQRFALDWVKENIHLFGGDPERVTVFGQSAGAASILHQITAYGGMKGPVPFQRAVLNSPGFQPYPSSYQQNQLFHQYLDMVNASTVDEARQLPFQVLQDANIALVANSSYGRFTFSPALDGSFVPGLPGQLLLHGGFDKAVEVMTSHNINETLLFVDQNATSDAAFRIDLASALPAIQPSIVDYVAEDLYPPVESSKWASDPSPEYYSNLGRSLLSSSEVSFTCNAYYLNQVYSKLHPNRTYSYSFGMTPGYHGQDVQYTYFNGDTNPPTGPVNETVARWMQTYITEFAITGNPNRKGSTSPPAFTTYSGNSGKAAALLQLTDDGTSTIPDPQDNERCKWWQKGLYY